MVSASSSHEVRQIIATRAPAAESGAERGGDSGAGWSYLSRHCSHSLGIWAHGSRAPRSAPQRGRCAQPGKLLVNGVVRSFAPTRIHAGGPSTIFARSLPPPVSTLLPVIVRARGPRWCPAMERDARYAAGANDVPQRRSVRYNDRMWGRNPPADVRLVPDDGIDPARPGAGGVHPRFDAYVLQYAPVNWGLSFRVIPGGDLHDARRSSRSISLIGRPGA